MSLAYLKKTFFNMNDLENKYLTTEGRVNRKIFIKYILFLLMSYVLIMLIAFVGVAIISGIGFLVNDGTNISLSGWEASPLFILIFVPMAIGIFYLVAILIPFNFLAIRRLHDMNASGWWLILPTLIPIVPIFFFIFLMCKKGTDGDNRYGADPLAKIA